MDLTLNGRKVTYTGKPETTLLKFLRDEKRILSPKDGCSGQGSCGACAVEVNGKSVLSCVTPMKRMEGADILTTEGWRKEAQDIYAHTFVKEGGIQCGFCIPGIVITAKTLLDNNPSPTREEVKASLNKHICRCTGYTKIENSILEIAKILRGEKELEIQSVSGKIGTRQAKFDAYKTVLGHRYFVADMAAPGMLHGALKFSDYPRALVKHIDLSDAKKFPGVKKILTAHDIPGQRQIGIVINDWSMMIAQGEITRYIGDVLALVIADTEEIAREAVKLIKIDYQVLPAVFSVEDALRDDAPLVHKEAGSNVLSVSQLVNGDPEEAFKEAAHIVEETFYSQRIEHAFLEPECCLSVPEKDGGLTVYSQGQGVYVDQTQIAKITEIAKHKINVVQVQNGGGFGGKEDMTVQGHSALGAMVTGHPVRVALTREESLIMHPKRHPMKLEYKLACDHDGNFTAMKARIYGDTGAYASVGMKVLERAAGHATGAYEVPNIDLKATAAYTNNVPCGAMRGFGVNQAAFAFESCIDMLCEKGGFDRFDIRYQNALDEGRTTSTGQKLGRGVGLRKCLEAVKDDFKNAKYAGIACGIKNTGIGNGMPDTANAKIFIQSENKVIVSHGWTEMGQGVHTMALQTVCEETGISPDKIVIKNETHEGTECGMTTASRGTSLVGNSLINTCKGLKEDLKTKPLSDLVGKTYKGSWTCDWTNDCFAKVPPKEPMTHYSYGYAAQVVILNDDGKVEKVVAAHDAGRIMNPTLFEGQIEGAVHMGLGYALSEDCPWVEGRPESTRYSKLGILKAKDMPEVKVIGIEAGDEFGPFGAKGVGEIGLVPTAGAVANALKMFDGKRRFKLPMKD